jgi:hypothetical protein
MISPAMKETVLHYELGNMNETEFTEEAHKLGYRVALHPNDFEILNIYLLNSDKELL